MVCDAWADTLCRGVLDSVLLYRPHGVMKQFSAEVLSSHVRFRSLTWAAICGVLGGRSEGRDIC